MLNDCVRSNNDWLKYRMINRQTEKRELEEVFRNEYLIINTRQDINSKRTHELIDYIDHSIECRNISSSEEFKMYMKRYEQYVYLRNTRLDFYGENMGLSCITRYEFIDRFWTIHSVMGLRFIEMVLYLNVSNGDT